MFAFHLQHFPDERYDGLKHMAIDLGRTELGLNMGIPSQK